MPELPEVEVVRQSLDKKIKQKKVKKVIVRNRKLRFEVPLNLTKFLKNQKIIKVGRYSKYLILHLSNNAYCLIHLGMSGTIHTKYKNKNNLVTNTSFYNSPMILKKHNHIEIIFDKLKIIYNDPRRFGFFQIIKSAELLKKRFAHLGPEPFESKFDLKYVSSFLNGKNKKIKNFMLDQNFISGIGNIYANEILFMSKINPNKKARLLKKKDYKKIIIYSKRVLSSAIKKGGSSIRDFKSVSGKIGTFQKDFKVYEREGQKCKRLECSGTIRKKFFSNRSTFFCNTCQK